MVIKLGMTAHDIRRLIEMPVPAAVGAEQVFEMPPNIPVRYSLPKEDPAFEDRLILGCAFIFLGLEEAARLRPKKKSPRTRQLHTSYSTACCRQKRSSWGRRPSRDRVENHPIVRDNYLRQSERAAPAELFRNHKEVTARKFTGMIPTASSRKRGHVSRAVRKCQRHYLYA